MSVTVSYGHLIRGLNIVSVAIPMASSCSIYLYNVFELSIQAASNSSLYSWRSVWRKIVAVSAPLSAPSPRQNSSGPQAAGQNGVSYTKRVPGVQGSKALGSENPLIAQLPDTGYALAI